jgi:hypothetical protein
MRLVNVKAATFLIGKKRFDSETLLIIIEHLFRSLHITDPIQGLGFVRPVGRKEVPTSGQTAR